MNTLNLKYLFRIPSVLSLVVFAVACGEDNVAPSEQDIITAPDDESSETSETSETSEASDATATDSGTEDASTNGDETAAPDDREECSAEPDSEQDGRECWDVSNCRGTRSIQFLDQCSDTCLAPFDNSRRIEGFTGTLPPLN